MNVPIIGAVDERFLMHRLRSTSAAGIASGLVAGGLFLYRLVVDHVRSWDLAAVLGTAVVVKLVVLVWYRLKD
jgi:hypothetical protein